MDGQVESAQRLQNEAAPVPLWRNGSFLLVLLAVFELVVFLALVSIGRENFTRLTWGPDTPSYFTPAEDLVNTGSLQPAARTPGYPAFLLPSLWFGQYRHHYVITVQLLLNLVFAAAFWQFLKRLPVGHGTRVVFCAFFAVAGIGMAIWVLSDFLGALALAGMVVCLLTRRTWTAAAMGGLCLALCVLIRPAYTFLVPMMPVLAFFAGRFSGQKLRLSHLAVYILIGALGPLGNHFQSSAFEDRLTPPGTNPPFLVGHIRQVLREHYHPEFTVEQWRTEYNQRLSQVAGAPYEQLTRGQMEHAASEMLKQEFLRRPMPLVKDCSVCTLKYIFVPVESLANSVCEAWKVPGASARRVAMTLLWLPVWLLCLFPPRDRAIRSLYYFALAILLPLAILSSPVSGCGERIRFPALIVMMAVGAVNVASALAAIRKRRA